MRIDGLKRKDRERLLREQRLLDIAEGIIRAEGFAALNMDRIAELAEYSKGTIYLHFTSREDVLMQLCLRGLRIWRGYFERARDHNGVSRERLLAMHWGHHVFARAHPVAYQAVYLVRSPGVREKISLKAHADYETAMAQIVGLVAGVVRDAEAAGDVVLPADLSPHDLTFGFWSLHFGSMVLQEHAIGGAGYGMGEPDRIKRAMLRSVLDGLGWQPLPGEFDYGAATERILRDVFGAESAALGLRPAQ